MSFGIMYVLLVVFVAGVLLSYLPRHVLLKIVQTAVLFFIGLALVVLLYGFLRTGDPPWQGWFIAFILFLGLGFLFVRLLGQWFGPASGDAGPHACPPVGRLEALLAERLPPALHRRLAAHLEVCKACQLRIEGLTAGHKSWPGLAGKLSDRPAAPEPALKKVMEKLKGESEPEATRDEPRFAGDLPLSFLAPTDKPGQLGRLERYEVLEEIGRGGMGVVLKAFDPSLHRVVAIKVLAPQLATSGVARKRFLREARAAAAVSHDHIVTIHAVDEANGLPYLVMQYVAGRSLQERLDKEGPLELGEVVRIGMQTASGLAAAHAHGIVHRDIKPANVLLEEGVPRVKITDFGLARAMDDASLTQSGCVAGSPLYMAPEQARGEPLDPRSDLFSLGSVLYTMCTGRPPFRAANTLAVLRRVSEDTPRPIRETNPEVPDWLAAVVEKLMAKDPAERYQSAAEVVEVLGQHLAQLQNGAWVPPPRPPAPAGASAAGLPTSVTICPSCGASLHVPERMVGSVVHCAECGKPFHVEEGSEVIQVARAVAPPFGRRPRRKVPRWVWVAAGFAILLLLFMAAVSFERKRVQAIRMAEQAQATISRKPTTAAAGIASVTPERPPLVPFWMSALAGLPAEATVFGALNLGPFGPLTLDDTRTQKVLRLFVSAEAARRLTAEDLGRIQLDAVGAAYYEGARGDGPWGIVHLQGVALDGRKRILDFLNRTAGDKVRVEENDQKGTTSPLIRVGGGELPFALGLSADHHAFLARSLKAGASGPQHLRALEQHHLFDFSNAFKHTGDVLTGYNPPWVKAALAEIPPDACGFLLGEIPADWRKLLTEALELRVCPRTFVLHLRREGNAVAVSLTLSVNKAGEDLVLREDLERWRLKGPDVLHARLAAQGHNAGPLTRVGQALKSMHCEAGRGSVRTRVKISDPTWQALGELLQRVVP
jgi:serine/threonine-protein kinase